MSTHQINNQLPFNTYGANIYSQNGEDGIICEILRQLNMQETGDFWCVEFGAWDGKHLSNTFNLVDNYNWNAVYIEGDKERFKDLLETASKYKKIIPIEAYVARYEDDIASLDQLLASTDIPHDFDILSIDIDSYDCDIWDSLKKYSPKIVIIEINSSIPPGIIWRHGNRTPGNTFTATLNVGLTKGYKLICHTGNLIFVKNEHVSSLKIDKKFLDDPNLLFVDSWIPQSIYNYRNLSFHDYAKKLMVHLKKLI